MAGAHRGVFPVGAQALKNDSRKMAVHAGGGRCAAGSGRPGRMPGSDLLPPSHCAGDSCFAGSTRFWNGGLYEDSTTGSPMKEQLQ